MPEFNYIIADTYSKCGLALELLTINHINKTKNWYKQCIVVPNAVAPQSGARVGQCPTVIYQGVQFFEVPLKYATFDKLVSIMGPHGIKVITGKKFRDNRLDRMMNNYTLEIHNSLYDADDNRHIIPPSNIRKHLESLLEGIHFIYRYNLDELMLSFPEWHNKGIHKLRHQALLNRMTTFLQKKMIEAYCNQGVITQMIHHCFNRAEETEEKAEKNLEEKGLDEIIEEVKAYWYAPEKYQP